MGRREKPLDPTDGPVARFALELRKLRDEAGGITYRAMAAQAHYSTATLADAAAGRRLPSREVAVAYATACGGDPDLWAVRWEEVAEEVAGRPRDDGLTCPYPGLARFEPADRDRFFGRDRIVERLAALVASRSVSLVVGPSGSGKSSLLRAGLAPVLEDAGSAVRIVTPGRGHLCTRIEPQDAHSVLIVDQFEEVFTLREDPDEQARFIDLLLEFAHEDDGARPVLAVRADFLGHCAQHLALAEAVEDGTVLVTPMGPDELREAVVKPAAVVGLVVERSLTARIVDEVAREPGGLPLMSHALLETWLRRRGRTLTEAAYEAAGGIRGSIARTAEELHEELTVRQREVARLLLLRLVAPGLGTQDTRRPTAVAELDVGEGDEAAAVLERLVAARLVTIDEGTADLAHEALLTAWPRLSEWIDQDRDRIRVQQRVTEAADGWEALGRDSGALYRGANLALAERCFPGDRDGLTTLERTFLDRSVAARERTRRRRRTRTVVLSALLAVAMLASLVAWQQNRIGDRRRTEATARRAADVAESLRSSDPTTAMRLSLAAARIADLPETRSAVLTAAWQPEQAAFTDPTSGPAVIRRLSTDGRTLTSIGADQTTRWDLDTGRRVAQWPGLGKDAEQAGTLRSDAPVVPVFARDWTGVLFVPRDLATGRGASRISADAGAEMGPGGDRVIGYSRTDKANVVRLWDASDSRKLLELAFPRERDKLTDLSSDANKGYSLVRRFLRDRRDGQLTETNFPDATLSPDGERLAVCVSGERIRVWDVRSGRRLPTPWAPRAKYECLREHVLFTPDSKGLVFVDDDGVRVWDLASGRQTIGVKHNALKEVAFSQDGTQLVATDGSEILLWRLDRLDGPVFRHALTGQRATDLRVDPRAGRIRYIGGPPDRERTVYTLELRNPDARWQAVPAVTTTFARNGTALASMHPGADNRTLQISLIRPDSERTVGKPSPVACPINSTGPWSGPQCQPILTFDSSGNSLLFGSSGLDSRTGQNRLVIWDMRRQVATPVTGQSDKFTAGAAFGPRDRSLLFAEAPKGDEPVALRLWDPRRQATVATMPVSESGDGSTPNAMALRPDGSLLVTDQSRAYELPSGRVLPAADRPGEALAMVFSPDGGQLAVGDRAGRVGLWNGDVNRRLGELAGAEPEPGGVTGLAFTPNGRILAVATATGVVRLWDTRSHSPVGSPLPVSGDTPMALAFSADGNTLYIANERAPLQRQRIDLASAQTTVCQRAAGGLTPVEWKRLVPDVPYRQTCPTTVGPRPQG
ncbi:AAA family ATPase [Actinomadura oligospora]|uniref:nSTAND1 domain-containing NTPase n=1 Tax=Actinomadura oligospora TaxID=111804 RepID=UPI0004B49F01|nr:AAA family ATPase [Actinomadura oligospora]